MKVKELIKRLKQYEDRNVEVIFKLIPNDGREEETDEFDITISCVGEIYTGGVECGGALPPYVEIGFQEI